jgi:transcriptional regulator with AAA-type ATPase domain
MGDAAGGTAMTGKVHPGIAATTAIHAGVPSDAPAPRFLVAAVGGGLRIHTLPFEGPAILGRSSECDVLLDDASISRQHARLQVGATCSISDLGSRNGTMFRGRRLAPGEECKLGYGDSFSLGAITLLLLPPGVKAPTAALGGSRLVIDDPAGDDPAGLVTAIAEAPTSLIIYGETGVGKEVLAARLHQLSGRKGPLVAINCAALTESLLESELFGHERGAFTGAVQSTTGLLQSAAQGTVLLDEIGEMAPSVQAKLLRAIETQSVVRVGGVRPVAIDVRTIAATHRDLLARSQTGEFRRDLYYRLAGFVLEIPPLRARRHLVPRLAMELLATAAARAGLPAPAITPTAAAALVAHDWPGNVRELRNVVGRALLLARGGDLTAEHVLFDSAAGNPIQEAGADERTRIVAALDTHAGNQTRAARALGISRTTLVTKLRQHQIPRPRSR